MRREQPLVQRNMRPLVKCAHRRREGLLASAALVEAGARALALELRSLVYDAAMRADRTIGPAQGFKVLPSGSFVRENLFSKVASHGQFLYLARYLRLNPVCQVHNSPQGEGGGC